jgi:hypothetical protein
MDNKSEFLVEQDCFSLGADEEEGIEEKWWKLAENLLGEKRSTKYTYWWALDVNKNEHFTRDSLIDEFQLAIQNDPELQSHLSSSGPLDKGYLTRFLRAGRWEVAAAVEVLRSYSCLGRDYTQYVARAIPSRLVNIDSLVCL